MTQYFQVDPDEPTNEALRPAAKILEEGGLVAFPTETVYALSALASLPAAVERLRSVKERPDEKPFTYLLADRAAVGDLVREVPAAAVALMDRYWPGPLTLVLRKEPGSDETVGLRVPANPIALQLLEIVGQPLLAPSANPAGGRPATSAEDVRAYFDGTIDAVVDGGPAPLKEPSSVVQVDENGSKMLRVGLITPEMVHQLLSGKRVLFVCTGNTCRSPMAAALFRKHLARKLDKSVDELEELGYRIASAGVLAAAGSRATQAAVEVMKESGCDLSTHRSQPVTPDLAVEADLIFTMTGSHRDAVSELLDAETRDKVSLLSEQGIPDPIGGDVETYRECARAIETEIERIVAAM